MPQQTMQQVRVVDPILSNVVQGFRQQEHVGMSLFPRVPVVLSGGRIIEFGKEAFRLYNARRAPGTATRRVTFGYEGKPYALVQDALEGVVPREHLRDARQQPGIDLGTRAVNNVMRSLSLALEVEQADLARNAALYDADHKADFAAAKWGDDANNPAKDVRGAQEAIRETVGVNPNTLVLSAKAFAAVRENKNILDRFRFTSADSVTTAMLAALLDIDRVEVGRAVVSNDAGALSDVWGADAVLAYVPGSPSSQEEPSYGYTYTMDGHPLTEDAYWDPGSKSWIYPVTYERVPVLSGISSGFLFQNVA